MSQIVSPQRYQTRHIMAVAMTLISSIMTGAGLVQGHLPDWSHYLVANIIPAFLAVIDWINARVKEWYALKNPTVGDALNIATQLPDLKNRILNLETQIKNFPTALK